MQNQRTSAEGNYTQSTSDKLPLNSGEVKIGKNTYMYKASLVIDQETSSIPKANYLFEVFQIGKDEPIARFSLFLVSKEFALDRLESLVDSDNYNYVVEGFIFVGSEISINEWMPGFLFNLRMSYIAQFIDLLKEKSVVQPGEVILSHVLASSENILKTNKLKPSIPKREVGDWTNIMMLRYNRSLKEGPYVSKKGRNYTHYFKPFYT